MQGIVNTSAVVLAQRVSKVYPLYKRPSDRILEVFPFVKRRRHTEFWALRDVSFRAEKGEILALVGPNGSGKSTLLQIVSGLLQPTRGRVLTEGRVAALLELGAGFNPEFTGRENVYLNGEIMGLSRREVDHAFPSIEAFAEIGEFINRPVKEYSSGMYVRLAFATAIHVEPEILIVDEALAVGDAIFANRCIQKFEELKQRQVTILFVSHDLGLVKRLAHRAILLLNGEIAAQGTPSDVVNRYVGFVLERQQAKPAEDVEDRSKLNASFRHGDGASRIRDVHILDQQGQSLSAVASGSPITVRVRAEFTQTVVEPVVGILVRNRLGIDVYGTNTRIEQRSFGRFDPGDVLEVDFKFDCLLTRQEYTLTAATQHWDGAS
ncbi:MAG: ABC transporter ATP-binding protein, partial [Candidatus Hydrogenedentes bacterium]|nr:ABC transporter ATP-binding protein [Candidatus Hydrogenedentota bacterium]